jgi:hypothetical protein
MIKPVTSVSGKSVSGYLGDKEDPSVNRPVYSIDWQSDRDKKNNSPTDTTTNKRQKTNTAHFAATTAKDDLDRAGMEFKTFDRDNEEVKAPGSLDVTINLKGVRLMHSKEVTGPLIFSNVSAQCTVGEYEALSHAVSESYPSSAGGCLKSFEASPERQDNVSSDSQSTSSVTDTESDSGSENINNGLNNQIFLIPPLVEDSLDVNKTNKFQPMSTCNVISCASNATTMAESLQLSTDPRCAAASCCKLSVFPEFSLSLILFRLA